MTAVRSFFQPAWRAFAAALVMIVVVSACGGGVDSGGTGAPAHSFSTGRISGFGSIVVNGVHFDESMATIVDDDGVTHPASDLQLGMTVDVDAGQITPDEAAETLNGVATRVQFGSAIDGPVQAVDTASSTLTVLGQTVKVNVDTVFDGLVTGLSGVRTGSLLKIFALLDTVTGTYTATRIELKSTLPQYKLRGVVSNLNTSAKTFSIGAANIAYASASPSEVPVLANGAIVRVKLATAQQGGLWVLAHANAAPPPMAPDDAQAELDGYITDFASLANFKVNGTTVDASGTGVSFKKGTSSQLANGVRIEVEGTVHNGVLQASSVEIKQIPVTPGSGDDEDQEEVDLHGAIESVDPANSSFVLHGTAVVFDANTEFQRGTAADLAVGVDATVKGVLIDNGTRVRATRIRLKK